MAVCEVCGKPILDAKRSSRRLCSARCRKVASRRAKAARREAEVLAMLQKLRAVLPRSAASAEGLVSVFGLDCAEAAVKLALTAYSEAVARGV